MSQFSLMFKTALANIRKTPGFAITVLLSLGITMGTLLTAVSMNNLVFVKALPYPDHNSLYVAEGVVYDKEQEVYRGLYTYPAMTLLHDKQTAFSASAIMRYSSDFITSLAEQPKVELAFVSPEFFALTGHQMAIGRGFDSSEAVGKALPVAVLSYDMWQSRFAGQQDILSQKIQIGDVSYQIVGVTAANFSEPALHSVERRSEVYLPWDFFTNDERDKNDWMNFNDKFRFIGKLAKGVSLAQANAQLTEVLNPVFKERTTGLGYFKTITVSIELRSFQEVILGSSKSATLMLLFGVLVIVLIAAANICNLFLSRMAEKQRQMAIQATVGAQQKHLFIAILVETSVLVGAAFVFAVIIGVIEIGLLKKHALDILPRIQELSIDTLSVGIVLLFSLLIAFFFSITSIKTINYRQLRTLLQSSGKGVGAQVSKSVRSALIASQVALAVVLITASISLLFEAQKVVQQNRGVSVDDIYELAIDTGIQTLSRERRIEHIRDIKELLMQQDVVHEVSASGVSAVSRSMWATALSKTQDKNGSLKPNTTLIDENFFAISGITVVEGTNFSTTDVIDKNRLAIVNQALAKQLGSTDVIGSNVYWENEELPYTIVGIVSDTHVPGQESQPRLYLPGSSSLNFVIAMKPGKALNRLEVVNIVKQVSSQFKVAKYVDTADVMAQMLFSDRLTAYLSLILTAITFFLATVGIYGVVSFGVRLRRFELGIRMSIGATTKQIFIHVFSDYLRPVAVGIIVAFAIVFGAMQMNKNGNMLLGAIQFSSGYLLLTILLVLLAVVASCLIGLNKITGSKPVFLLRNQTK